MLSVMLAARRLRGKRRNKSNSSAPDERAEAAVAESIQCMRVKLSAAP